MSCSRKKKVKQPKVGRHQCQVCGQVRKKPGKLCKPEEIDDLQAARERLGCDGHTLVLLSSKTQRQK